jgi:hypothetical protein
MLNQHLTKDRKEKNFASKVASGNDNRKDRKKEKRRQKKIFKTKRRVRKVAPQSAFCQPFWCISSNENSGSFHSGSIGRKQRKPKGWE